MEGTELVEFEKNKSLQPIEYENNNSFALIEYENNNSLEHLNIEDKDLEFFLAEIIRMEGSYSEIGENTLNLDFCQELATKFSCSKRRQGKPSVQREQVQSWFQEKHNKALAKITMSPIREDYHYPEFSSVDYTQECRHKSKAERIASLSGLVYEAKSAKDDGWYDVAAFLNYRITCHGELVRPKYLETLYNSNCVFKEARVRFAGFSYDQDEWLNVKSRVRERSVPLESSECNRVKAGDTALCFRETDSLAIYCDAEILAVQRTSHDDTCCTCSFVIRYYSDMVEEQVGLSKICCCPT